MKTLAELKTLISATENALEKAVLINNYKAVLYNDDVINTVIATLEKYKGKKIGEKTLEKVNAEIEKAFPEFPVRVWFSSNVFDNRDTVTIFRRDSLTSYSDDITITTYSKTHGHNSYFDDESRFKGFIETTTYNKKQYIDDVDSYIQAKTEQFHEIQSIIEQYEKMCDVFRKNKVDGLADLPWIRKPHYITKWSYTKNK